MEWQFSANALLIENLRVIEIQELIAEIASALSVENKRVLIMQVCGFSSPK
jgi:hypothetical protein